MPYFFSNTLIPNHNNFGNDGPPYKYFVYLSSEELDMNYKELKAQKSAILQAAAKRGVKQIRLCGSMARGEAGPNSDVDFLVDFEPGRSLLDQGGLLMDLQEILGCRVHIISEGSLQQRYRDRVISEAIPI
jgi:predicted nucleotidyltransferase